MKIDKYSPPGSSGSGPHIFSLISFRQELKYLQQISNRLTSFFFFYLFRRKERSNRARDQILSTKCRGCPTLSADGLKHLYSDIRLYWQAGTKVPPFHWSRGGRLCLRVCKRQERAAHNTRVDRQGNSCSRMDQLSILHLLKAEQAHRTVAHRRLLKHMHTFTHLFNASVITALGWELNSQLCFTLYPCHDRNTEIFN